MNKMNLNILVEKQIQRWQLRKDKGEHLTQPATLPVVTISRHAGIDGSGLGRRIADELGYDFWDQELLHAMAEHAHVSETLLATLDEQPSSYIADIVTAFLSRTSTQPDEYLNELFRQVQVIAQHGHSVVMGRGAQFILKPDRAFRVRLIAPLEHRVERFAKSSNTSSKEARNEILLLDAKRERFTRQNWSEEIESPCNYDLVLNVEGLTHTACAVTVAGAYWHRFEGKMKNN